MGIGNGSGGGGGGGNGNGSRNRNGNGNRNGIGNIDVLVLCCTLLYRATTSPLPATYSTGANRNRNRSSSTTPDASPLEPPRRASPSACRCRAALAHPIGTPIAQVFHSCSVLDSRFALRRSVRIWIRARRWWWRAGGGGLVAEGGGGGDDRIYIKPSINYLRPVGGSSLICDARAWLSE